mmetsp:Transcript_73970/g.154182  ORF Transcript_73970/g.154182 Transcript_73970/m.154182 type:complete len:136 (-) Transcript_73970:324-731(-)
MDPSGAARRHWRKQERKKQAPKRKSASRGQARQVEARRPVVGVDNRSLMQPSSTLLCAQKWRTTKKKHKSGSSATTICGKNKRTESLRRDLPEIAATLLSKLLLEQRLPTATRDPAITALSESRAICRCQVQSRA